MESFIEVALRVGEALEEVGAAYFIGGSFASSFRGEPRATMPNEDSRCASSWPSSP